jgi:DNA-directed RNA polymerase subunit N (RpoN/RPB10)
MKCGKPLSNKWFKFQRLLKEKYKTDNLAVAIEKNKFNDNRDITDKIGVTNLCCKAHLITSVNVEMLL